MLTPVVLGADKTTVSVISGHQQYHPVYMSLGNIHNEMRRAHREAVTPLAFMAIPKSTFFACQYSRSRDITINEERIIVFYGRAIPAICVTQNATQLESQKGASKHSH